MKKVKIAQVWAMLKEILATSGGDLDKVNAVVTIQLEYALRLNRFSSLGELDDIIRALKESAISPDVNYATKLKQHLQRVHNKSVEIAESDWQKFEQLYGQRVLTLLPA